MKRKTADKEAERIKGRLNTKLYIVVAGLRNPVEFMLSAGNDHNSVAAVELLEKVKISGSNVLADRVYKLKTIRDYILQTSQAYTLLYLDHTDIINM